MYPSEVYCREDLSLEKLYLLLYEKSNLPALLLITNVAFPKNIFIGNYSIYSKHNTLNKMYGSNVLKK